MKFEVSTEYLAPILLDAYEHVTVVLLSGHRVDVYEDEIRVAEPGTHPTTDGKRIWKAERKRA